MSDAPPPLQQLNRTLIGSVLFIDIVDYSTRTVPDQIAMKELFIGLLTDAVRNVASSDRIMVDTGDGAGVAFLGDPEDALFAALSLRDAVDAGAAASISGQGFVRMGINLGPLKVVRDINGHTNMIGDAVNDAQRVMSFAEPGQVMVSHSYYDIISRFSRDYSKLFVYEGTRHDKHVREHEVYRFGPAEGSEILTEKLRDRSRARHPGGAATAPPAPIMAAPVAPGAGAAPPAALRAAARKISASRTGLIAMLLGAITIVGAVWSWTSAPNRQPGPQSPAPASRAGVLSSAPTATKTASLKSAQTLVAPTLEAGAGKAPPAASASVSATPPPAAASTIPAAEKSAKIATGADSAVPAAKPGTVKLTIQPWGEIYVDGSKRGISPPLRSLSLTPGKHKVEIRNGQFAAHKETVEVKSGRETTVQYAF